MTYRGRVLGAAAPSKVARVSCDGLPFRYPKRRAPGPAAPSKVARVSCDGTAFRSPSQRAPDPAGPTGPTGPSDPSDADRLTAAVPGAAPIVPIVASVAVTKAVTKAVPMAASMAVTKAVTKAVSMAVSLAVAIVVYIGVSISPSARAATEPVAAQEAIHACPGNLLVNPGFEFGFSGRDRPEAIVADGWNAWYAKLPGVEGLNYPPVFQPRNRDLDGPLLVLAGLWSQEQATHDATHTAGLWQRVPVPPGSVVSAFVSAHAWATDGADERHSEPPGTYFMSLGIDPRGGTDPDSADIVWTQGITVTDVWVPLALEMPVQTSTVTVFTRGQPMRILAHNVSRWDEACLRVLRAIDEPTATPTARQWPTRTRAPDEPEPTSTATATSDPATQAALDVGLALDRQATQHASSAAIGPDDDSARRGWADGPATPTADASTTGSDSSGPSFSGGRFMAERSGLLFLALGALAAGLLLGLSVRGPSRGDSGREGPGVPETPSGDSEREGLGARLPGASEGDQSP